MLKLQAVRGRFGKLYIIRASHNSNIPFALKAEKFTDSHSTKRFLMVLDVNSNYWHQITDNFTGFSTHQRNPSANISKASQLLIRGKLKAFDVTSLYLDKTIQKSKNSVLKKNDSNERYHFEPSLSLLTNQSANIKRFHKQEDATAFIKELAPDHAQLTEIINHVNAPNTPPPVGNLDDLIASLSQSIVEGAAVINVENNTSPPTKEKKLLTTTNSPGNRKAGLGHPLKLPAP